MSVRYATAPRWCLPVAPAGSPGNVPRRSGPVPVVRRWSPLDERRQDPPAASHRCCVTPPGSTGRSPSATRPPQKTSRETDPSIATPSPPTAPSWSACRRVIGFASINSVESLTSLVVLTGVNFSTGIAHQAAREPHWSRCDEVSVGLKCREGSNKNHDQYDNSTRAGRGRPAPAHTPPAHVVPVGPISLTSGAVSKTARQLLR